MEGERWGGEENGDGGQAGCEGINRGGGEIVGWRTVVKVAMKGMRVTNGFEGQSSSTRVRMETEVGWNEG